MLKTEIFNNIFGTSITPDVNEFYIYDVYNNGAVARMIYRFFSGSHEVKIRGFLVSDKGEDSFFEDIPILEYESGNVAEIPILIGSYDSKYIEAAKDKLISSNPDIDIITMKFDPGNYNLEKRKWIKFFEQFDIYNKLMDEESRMLYRYKIAFDIFCHDWRYIRELIRRTKGKDNYESKDYVNLLDFIKASQEGEKIRFVLAGEYSELIVERISALGYPVDAYLGDSDVARIPTIKKEDLFGRFAEHYILVKDYQSKSNLLENLLSFRVPRERLVVACNCECGMEYEHPMYFDNIFTPSADGIFVDGGCYTGETINDFIK